VNWRSKSIIVVPVDFSAAAWAAVDTGLDLAFEPCNVRVLHVLENLSVQEYGVLYDTVTGASRKQCVDRAIRKHLSDPRYGEIQIDVVEGNPAHCIADYARQVGAGLIVVASHSRSTWQRLLRVSVSERVVRLAPCPVLILREPHVRVSASAA